MTRSKDYVAGAKVRQKYVAQFAASKQTWQQDLDKVNKEIGPQQKLTDETRGTHSRPIALISGHFFTWLLWSLDIFISASFQPHCLQLIHGLQLPSRVPGLHSQVMQHAQGSQSMSSGGDTPFAWGTQGTF